MTTLFPYLFLVICTSLILMISVSKEEQAGEIIETKVFSYLALGDSYTIGEGVSVTERWPAILADSFAQDGRDSISLSYIATTGWTTRDLLLGIADRNPEPHDLVSLLIGVNNQYQNLPIEQFDQELDSLLVLGLSFADDEGQFFVVSIPDYGFTPFSQANKDSITAQLDRYNTLTMTKCQALDIPFYSITEISRALEGNPEGLTSDQLHPSRYQYQLWVDEIYPNLNVLLVD